MEIYSSTQQERLQEAQKKVKSIRGFYVHATVFVFVNLFIIAGCAADDLQSLFTTDPYMTAVFWGIGLAAHGMAVFGQDLLFGQNWEKKQVQKILNK
ncbi:2TM domain-containing protein [Kaistella palustris]|uniref:2TM domain-containing protein n=1 Tax=Kaistella palustris TaxID=493376 RepID=UPI0004116461|nr:2TM domain-containing protein [Kaistella palustris]